MKVVARQSAVGAQVVPIHAGARVPAASGGAVDARVVQLEGQFAQMVKMHNATVDALNRLQKEHTALMADHMTLKRGASSLAKHFQGFVAASQIQYTPAVIQRGAPPAAQQAPAQAQRVVPQARSPSQQTVNAAPAAQPAAQPSSVWEQRENLFYEGGEGEEG